MTAGCLYKPTDMAPLPLRQHHISITIALRLFSDSNCKENGPRAIWLVEFWCLMINTIRELISFLVFVFVVYMMLD
jgi:hypothetical protein